MDNRFGQPEGVANKTTAAGSRWYNYCDFFAMQQAAVGSSVAYSFPYLWKNNRVMMMSSSSVLDTNDLVTYGMVLNPVICPGFNDSAFYLGDMKISVTDSYTVDSIAFSGIYEVNPAQTTVDTLRLSFVYATGGPALDIYEVVNTISATGPLPNYGIVGSTLKNWRMHLDSSRLTAKGPTLYTYDVLLNNAISPPSWAADTVGGLYLKSVPVGITVPAHVSQNVVGATVSFISGATVPLWDTVYRGSTAVPTVKYNMFRPGVMHRGTSTAILFPPHLNTSKTNGVFIDKPTTYGFYEPQWFWLSPGGSASPLQYPAIAFKLSCTTCGTVDSSCPGSPGGGGGGGGGGGTLIPGVHNEIRILALPNPANDELNIRFDIGYIADVTVALSNVLGQVVATKSIDKTAKGEIHFKTATLPEGIYIYNVIANGVQHVGRVLVVH